MNTIYKEEASVAPMVCGGGTGQGPAAMKQEYGNKAGTAAALMVFCVIAVSVFTVLLLGAGAYRNITDASLRGYNERACLSYIWTKIKTGDEAGKVYVGEFHGLPAFFIDEEYGDAVYHTVIYHYDGYVYELFFEDGYEYRPEQGVPVAQNESLLLEQMDSGLIKVSAGSESIFISLRGKKVESLPRMGDVR